MSRDDKTTTDDTTLSSVESRASAGVESYRDDRKKGVHVFINYSLLDNAGRNHHPIPKCTGVCRDFVAAAGLKPRQCLVRSDDMLVVTASSLDIPNGSRCTP